MVSTHENGPLKRTFYLSGRGGAIGGRAPTGTAAAAAAAASAGSASDDDAPLGVVSTATRRLCGGSAPPSAPSTGAAMAALDARSQTEGSGGSRPSMPKSPPDSEAERREAECPLRRPLREAALSGSSWSAAPVAAGAGAASAAPPPPRRAPPLDATPREWAVAWERRPGPPRTFPPNALAKEPSSSSPLSEAPRTEASSALESPAVMCASAVAAGRGWRSACVVRRDRGAMPTACAATASAAEPAAGVCAGTLLSASEPAGALDAVDDDDAPAASAAPPPPPPPSRRTPAVV